MCCPSSLEEWYERQGGWLPAVGSETLDFLERVVPESSQETVRNTAASILGHGIAPVDQVGRETGLVVGYVQSGKTMSFEAVATLARDNNFQMVIIIAGTSNPLLDQSTGRVRRDLRLDDPDRARSWVHFQNSDLDDSITKTCAMSSKTGGMRVPQSSTK